MSPLPAFLLILTGAATGWWLGLPAPATAPPAAPERPATRMATGGKPDAVQEAARHYLRVCALRERKPRDFAGEWAENLDRKGLIAAWAAGDPDGFLDWFAREGWEQWGWLDAEFTAVFRGHEEWLVQVIPRLPLDKQDSYCSTVFPLILSLPPAEAAALLARYADALAPHGSGSGIRGADSPELLEALSAALPPGPARQALLRQLAGSVANAHPAEAGAWWQRQDAATRALTAGAILAGYPAGKPPPWDDATLTALMEETLRTIPPADAGELVSGWIGFLAESDPAGALRWAAETLPVDSFASATGMAWNSWLERSPSPEAVAELLADLPARDLPLLSANVPDDPAVLTGLILPLLQQDPGSAAYQFAAESLRVFEGEGRRAAIVEWIESAPPDAVPASLLATTAEGKIDATDPASWGTALHWLAGLDGQPIQPAAQSVALGWFAQRPAEAATALSAEPPGPVRHAGIVGSARWLTDDPAAAGDWLVSLPAADRPSVLAALAQSRLSPAAQEGIRARLDTP